MLAEALILTLCGTIVGLAWSLLGIYLGSLVVPSNLAAAFAIRGIFLAVALLCHGFLRSHTPRLFLGVLLLVIVAVVLLTSPALQVTAVMATQILYPILLAIGVILVVNVCLFPEFSSAFMASTTIETLEEVLRALREGGVYFIRESQGHGTSSLTEQSELVPDQANAGGTDDVGSNEHVDNSPAAVRKKALGEAENTAVLRGPTERPMSPLPGVSVPKPVAQAEHPESATEAASQTSLKDLTAAKSKVRTKLKSCKAAQRECNFELALSVLPPQDLKPISSLMMNKMVANTIAVISACESKYALLGDETDLDDESSEDQGGGGLGKVNQHEQGSPDASDPEKDASRLSTPKSQKDFDEKATSRKRKERPPGETHKRTVLAQDDLDLVKPKREIEFGDVQLLVDLTSRIARPYHDLQVVLDRSVHVLTICIAYAYVRFPLDAFLADGTTDKATGRYSSSIWSASTQGYNDRGSRRTHTISTTGA